MNAADPRRFLYRDHALDPEDAKRLASRHLAACDDGELYLQYSATEAFGFDDGRLKTADFNTASGFGLRGVTGETTAFAHANEISTAAIERAAATLKLLDPTKGSVAASPPRTNQSMYGADDPLSAIPFADKVQLCQQIDAAARARDPRVAQVSVSLMGSWSVIEIVRADGFVASDVRPLVRLNVQIVAQDGARRETGYHGIGGRHLYDRLFEPAEWQRCIDLALHQAIVNLESVAAPAGEMTVLLGPGWPGVLLHEAVGHGLEGDFNRKKTSAFSGRLGQSVASELVTVVDDGTIRNRRGSLNVDDEGVPTRRNVLIEKGILRGYLQDRLNSRLMGMEVTGNGRRESYAHPPMPRMTNTFMLAGEDEPADIIRGVSKGLYAVNFGGGQVDITNGRFVFSASEAYLIEDGRVTRPVKGATLIGNGPEALNRVSRVGHDLKLDEGVGTCGKDGQSVPVGVGLPTIRIDRMTVGGTQV